MMAARRHSSEEHMSSPQQPTTATQYIDRRRRQILYYTLIASQTLAGTQGLPSVAKIIDGPSPSEGKEPDANYKGEDNKAGRSGVPKRSRPEQALSGTELTKTEVDLVSDSDSDSDSDTDEVLSSSKKGGVKAAHRRVQQPGMEKPDQPTA